jgi:hypothetical protein
MSKTVHSIYYFAFVFALILIPLNNLRAQTVQIKIKIAESNAFVEGSFIDVNRAQNVTNFSFLKSYANIENLGTRIADVNLFDKNGQKVNYKKLGEGEFRAESAFRSWNYKLDLSVPKSVSAMAHVSWLSNDQGILMTGDLLPELAEKTAARIMLEVPKDWQISSVEKRVEENVFEVPDVEKAVFFVGKDRRELLFSDEIIGAKNSLIIKNDLGFLISGEFLFADGEAAKMAAEIFINYQELFGAKPNQRTRIFLLRFPEDTKSGRWEAETRGANIVIISSDMPFKTHSVQRLHEQLRHEIFHLWFPNGANLAGDYDWFYEGFALYVSLKTAVAMNRIRFEDFLETLARAHSIDSLQSQRQSLIEASKNRWNGANTQVYARGMLVAFLTDIALLQKTKGKSGLPEVLREIYQKHGFSAQRQDGNTAILNILQMHNELRPIVEKYIKGTETIAWQTDLAAIGIESATENFTTKLKVSAKLNGRQKDLLDKLGYNNWRKNSESSK